MENIIKQSKLWVYTTAFIMSFNGGYINSICLVSILKNAVGYVTGNLTLAGDYFERGNFLLFSHLLLLVVCFLFGSIISGLIIKKQNLERDHRYNISLILQSLLVLTSIFLLLFHKTEASYLLAITMGMQNAMTTHYGTALIRTTHMTGTTTDLGIIIARWIKGHTIEYWKLILYISLISGFLFGAVVGAIMYSFIHIFALFISISIYILMLKLRN
jgi:uncharacterized membrane protein YoaK (UPF0700 family)